LSPSGSISLYRFDGLVNYTYLALSSEAVTNDTWVYLEFKWLIDNTVGYAEVRANGIRVLRFDGDTKSDPYPQTAPSVWNTCRLLGMQSTSDTPKLIARMCDLYVADLSGSVNNDFIGDCVIDYIKPDGTGTNTNWTASPGPNNWDDVNDATPDGDTSYVYASTVGTKDTYSHEDVLTDAKAIQVVASCRRTTEGSAQLQAVVRSGGSEYNSLALGIADTTYSYLTWPYDTNPDTGAQWTDAQLDAAEFGPLKSS